MAYKLLSWCSVEVLEHVAWTIVLEHVAWSRQRIQFQLISRMKVCTQECKHLLSYATQGIIWHWPHIQPSFGLNEVLRIHNFLALSFGL